MPAGVEIENANIVQGEQNGMEIAKVDMRQAMQDTRIKHVEFRDDRFVVAARLRRRDELLLPRAWSPPAVRDAADLRGGYVPADGLWVGGGGEAVSIGDGKDDGAKRWRSSGLFFRLAVAGKSAA